MARHPTCLLNFQKTVARNGKWIGPFSGAVSLRVRCHGEGGIDGYKEAGGRSKVGKISANEKLSGFTDSCIQIVDVCLFVLLFPVGYFQPMCVSL